MEYSAVSVVIVVEYMTKYYSYTIRIISIITLIAFVFTQTALGYEGYLRSEQLLDRSDSEGAVVAKAEGTVIYPTKEEIAAAVDYINETAKEILFDGHRKVNIVDTIFNMRLVKGSSILVVGPGGYDYLPVLLTKLGIKTSIIDIDEYAIEQQVELLSDFGMQQSINVFSSYDDMGDKQFDYITIFGVLNEIVDIMQSDDLMHLFKLSISQHIPDSISGEAEKGLEAYFKYKIKDMAKPILQHLKPSGGRIFVNSSAATFYESSVYLEAARGMPPNTKALKYFEEALAEIGNELNIYFEKEADIGINDFTMDIVHLDEIRGGAVYTAKLTLGPFQNPDSTRHTAEAEPGTSGLDDDSEASAGGMNGEMAKLVKALEEARKDNLPKLIIVVGDKELFNQLEQKEGATIEYAENEQAIEGIELKYKDSCFIIVINKIGSIFYMSNLPAAVTLTDEVWKVVDDFLRDA